MTLLEFPIHLWNSKVFAGIRSVLGKPIRMDAHTAVGVNHEVARILVMMEANGKFPEEVLVFMTNNEGEEIEELVKILYWNPPPRCNRCVAFGHWSRKCKI